MARWTAAEALQLLLRNFLQRGADAAEPLRAGEMATGEALSLQLRKIRAVRDQGAPRQIGVLGAPKRGKSSLINALLKLELMPVARDFLSSSVIRTCRDPALTDRFKVIVHNSDGYQTFQIVDEPAAVTALIEQYGTRRGETSAEWIEISSAFPDAALLHDGGMLLDTPGAELAFECGGEDGRLERETARALAILDEVHIPVFCVRADQIGARSDAVFYQRELSRRHSFNVVNFRDRYEEADLLLHAVRTYGFPPDRVAAVSAREAILALRAGDRAAYDASGLSELQRLFQQEIAALSEPTALLEVLEEFNAFRRALPARRRQLLSRLLLANCRMAFEREIPESAAGDCWKELEKG
ncbi:dynamin family protein [Victivallis sp. Marseille-Q1083]|uniref:dynamin family protein n=1 Tax=Victivallis sp. Marseille-Q1083 TaxID=2717288 RepID=UPI00158F419A|nr:dynamin family protein [Victivallis sp. Marseille-Q1083]